MRVVANHEDTWRLGYERGRSELKAELAATQAIGLKVADLVQAERERAERAEAALRSLQAPTQVKRRYIIYCWAQVLREMREADAMPEGKKRVAAQERTRDKAMYVLQIILAETRKPDGWHDGSLT